MALPKLTTVLNKISTLATTLRGQATTVKAAFDHDVNIVKNFINDVLIPEIEATFETKDNITNNRKLSTSGDFTGTWNGLTQVQSDPGIQAIVNGHSSQLTQMETSLLNKVSKGEFVANVRDYGATGNGSNDDTAPILDAIAALDLLGGGVLYIPQNYVFTVDMLTLKSNIEVTGGGALKFKDNTTSFAILKADLLDNIKIHDIIIDGNIANQTTWSEFRHSVQIYGSTNVKIYNNKFINTIGDAIYISHNGDLTLPDDIEIYSNSFIGTSENRNAVSLIHGKNIRIHDNYMYYMGKDTMPANIDLEPDASSESIINVTICNNTIIGGGTPQLQHAVSVNNNAGGIIEDILISGNIISGVFNYAISVFGDNVDFAKTDVSVKDNIINETISLALSAAIILSARVNAEVACNTINATCDYGIKITGATFKVYGNTIKNALKHGIFSNGNSYDFGQIDSNFLIDCGTDAAGSYGGIYYTGSNTDIINNKIYSSATTKTQVGIYIATGVKNFISGNTFKGLAARAIISTSAPQVFGQNIYNQSFNSIDGTYPPTTESWARGDIIYNPIPEEVGTSPNKYIVTGWVCVESGTQSKWKQMRASTGA